MSIDFLGKSPLWSVIDYYEANMAGTTRRRLLLGGAAFSLSATTAAHESPGKASIDDSQLRAPGIQLDRLRRRARRLRAKVHPGGDPAAWSRWSGVVNECAELCEQIAKEPAHSLAGLAVKYWALLWELTEDDVILDRAVGRRAVAFGRGLEELAKRPT